MVPYFIEHALQIFQHIIIFEAQNLNAICIKKCRSPIIVHLSKFVIMSRAVQLNRQMLAGTIKINHKRTNTVLTTEFPAAKLATL